MLEELSKKNKLWREMALKICNDRDLADDLVQEMYLKLYDSTNNITDGFVYVVIKNLFLNYLRENKKTIPLSLEISIQDEVKSFEFDDKEICILKKVNQLRFLPRGLLIENYDLSIREIAKKYEYFGYNMIYNNIKNARKEVLGEEIHLYKNKRLKHLKNGKTKKNN